MTNPLDCHDKTRLVAYLYNEIDETDRDAVEAHLAGCRTCADEAASLESVRGELMHWQPPDAALGFRIVQETAPAVARPWWRAHAWVPAAMAAGLVLAVGAAIANVEVQVANGGITLRAGWSSAPSGQAQPTATAARAVTTAAPAAPAHTGVSESDVRQMLAAFETRLRADLAAAPQQRPSAAPVATSTASVDRQQILQRVQALIDESERRQQRELALRLAQVVQDFDAQRRTDLVRIGQSFGQIENLAGQEAARQRAMTNYLLRASQRQ